MPAATNRSTGKPVPQHGDRTALELQSIAAKEAEDAKLAAQTRALEQELAGAAKEPAALPAPPEPASIEVIVGAEFTGRLVVRIAD